VDSSRTSDRVTRDDLNEGTPSDLKRLLPGVGDVLAKRIVEHREAFGPFSSVHDLARVPGFGAWRAERVWESLDAPHSRESAERTSSVGDVEEAFFESAPESELVRLEAGQLHDERTQHRTPEPELVHADDTREVHATRSARRMWAWAIVAGVAVTSLAAVGGVRLARSVRDNSVAMSRTDIDGVRHEVDGLRDELAAEASARTRTALDATGQAEKLTELTTRVDAQERAVDEQAKHGEANEQRLKKIEHVQENQTRRLGKVEDDLLWQQMVSDSQIALLKKQVRSTADRVEGLSAVRASDLAPAGENK